jgi:hypothetical protein
MVDASIVDPVMVARLYERIGFLLVGLTESSPTRSASLMTLYDSVLTSEHIIVPRISNQFERYKIPDLGICNIRNLLTDSMQVLLRCAYHYDATTNDIEIHQPTEHELTSAINFVTEAIIGVNMTFYNSTKSFSLSIAKTENVTTCESLDTIRFVIPDDDIQRFIVAEATKHLAIQESGNTRASTAMSCLECMRKKFPNICVYYSPQTPTDTVAEMVHRGDLVTNADAFLVLPVLDAIASRTHEHTICRILVIFATAPDATEIVDYVSRERLRFAKFSITLLQVGSDADAKNFGTQLASTFPVNFDYMRS